MEYRPDMTCNEYHFFIIGKDHIIKYHGEQLYKSADLNKALRKWDESITKAKKN